MGALSKILRSVEGGGLMFWCPGCDGAHKVMTGAGPGPRWGYNGNPDAPTFTPSILVTSDQWMPPADAPEMAEKIKRGEVVQHKERRVCHSFVTDGRIQFLGDCTHALAGQTIEIPTWDDA